MAAKLKTVYICSACGYESAKWNGKCPSCGAWNTFQEAVSEPVSSSSSSSREIRDLSDSILELDDIGADNDVRYG